MKQYKINQLVFLLTPFVFSFALGLDIYIPIIPLMGDIFNTTPALVQLTMSLFLFMTGAGQLLIGPLSDQYGRKTIFYCSAACYAIGALGCAFSTHIAWLIIYRVISSVGACGMLVNSFAMVRDLYSNNESAKIFSFLNGAIGISPTFAPILGGYLAFYIGWQSVFFFLAFIGLLSFFITHRFIQETHEKEKRIRINKDVFNRYKMIFTNSQFLIYSCIAGLAEGVFFCFFSISPFIIIDLLGIPTHQFGYYFAAFGSVIALGGLAGGKIIESYGVEMTIKIGISLMFVGGISMLTWHYMASLSLEGFLIPMVIACTGAIFLVGSSASAALEPFGSIAGTASAAFGSIEFGLSAFAGSLLMLFSTHSTFPYGISILLMAAASTFLFMMRQEELTLSIKNPFEAEAQTTIRT